MDTNPPNRFDPLWHDALAFHAGMVCHANGARTALRLLYRDAYRFAAKIIEIQKSFHDEFVAHVVSTKSDVDAWMDEHFEPIERFGGHRRQLLANIQDGMTEKEYVEHSNTWGPQHRAKKRDVASQADTTAPIVTEDMSDAEKVTQFTTQLKAVISENKQLRRDNAVVLRENEQLKKDVARIERIVAGRKKQTA